MRYRLSELAEQDLLELWLHVAADAGPERADGVIDVIVSRFELLAEHPELGRSRPEFGKGVRSLPAGNHVIYYRFDDEPQIARVLHGRRDQLAAWQDS